MKTEYWHREDTSPIPLLWMCSKPGCGWSGVDLLTFCQWPTCPECCGHTFYIKEAPRVNAHILGNLDSLHCTRIKREEDKNMTAETNQETTAPTQTLENTTTETIDG